jgi:hypothetical protein
MLYLALKLFHHHLLYLYKKNHNKLQLYLPLDLGGVWQSSHSLTPSDNDPHVGKR